MTLEPYFDNDFSQEEIIEETGQVYIHAEGTYKGHHLEINEDVPEETFHARIDNDNSTAGVNMDQGGLLGWIVSHFGK